MAAITLMTLLFSPLPGSAGEHNTGPFYYCRNCPPSMYCPINYWAPRLWRWDAYCHPRPNIYPVNTTPEIVPQYNTWQYKCPGVNPAAQPYYPNLGTPEITSSAPQ
jgi:hypothetical protein